MNKRPMYEHLVLHLYKIEMFLAKTVIIIHNYFDRTTFYYTGTCAMAMQYFRMRFEKFEREKIRTNMRPETLSFLPSRHFLLNYVCL